VTPTVFDDLARSAVADPIIVAGVFNEGIHPWLLVLTADHVHVIPLTFRRGRWQTKDGAERWDRSELRLQPTVTPYELPVRPAVDRPVRRFHPKWMTAQAGALMAELRRSEWPPLSGVWFRDRYGEPGIRPLSLDVYWPDGPPTPSTPGGTPGGKAGRVRLDSTGISLTQAGNPARRWPWEQIRTVELVGPEAVRLLPDGALLAALIAPIRHTTTVVVHLLDGSAVTWIVEDMLRPQLFKELTRGVGPPAAN
jgi:hypothetical protein